MALLGAHEWDRYLRITGEYQTIDIWIWNLGTLVVFCSAQPRTVQYALFCKMPIIARERKSHVQHFANIVHMCDLGTLLRAIRRGAQTYGMHNQTRCTYVRYAQSGKAHIRII